MYLRGGVFVLLLVAISASGGFYDTDTSLDKIWQAYKQQHSKNYESDKEEQLRRGVWESNVDVIKRHNLEYDLGLHTFTMGINEYADLTFAEYQKYLLGAKPELRGKSGGDRRQYKPNLSAPLPTNVDWRQQGYVTPVKNQGQCGSCWAFSSTGALEGQHFRRTKQLVSLSEQNLVDCVTMNAGCGGGWMDNAFIYVERNMGIDTESSYPYETKQGACRFKPDNVGASASSLVDIPSYHEDYLKAAVAQEGPIAVAIDAAHQSFQLYKSGVYFEPECSHNATDHAVLAVGYGTTNTGYDYWLVKNSWGASWGEEGYIKMARNYDNMCAIATFASFPLSSDGTN